MAKGAEAKDIVTKKISDLFGADFVGIYDKKIYVSVRESSGEEVQIALTMTCPKNPIEVSSSNSIVEKSNVEASSSISTGEDIRPEEAEVVKNLMEKLGL